MVKWSLIERLVLYTVVLACAAFAGLMYLKLQRVQTPAAEQAAAMNAQVAKENAMRVGQTLPAGLVVKDAKGNDVDLRSTIHGNTLIFKVAMDCQPCLDTLAWLRSNGASFNQVEHANIIVLAVRSKAPPPGTFPADVHVLYTADNLNSGFLAGTFTPAEFLFDGQAKLVARQAGYDGDMATKLRFPDSM